MPGLLDARTVFADILPTPKQEMQAELEGLLGQQGSLLAKSVLGRTVNSGNRFKQGLTDLTGVDVRNNTVKLQEALQKLDTTTPRGQAEALEVVRQLGTPGQAETLRERFLQANISQQQADAQTANATANQVSAQASVLNAQAGINRSNAAPPRYVSVGGNLYDQEEHKWIAPEGGGPALPSAESLDPDDYNTGSWVRYQQAVSKARTQEEVIQAHSLLLPKPEPGWEWRESPDKNEDGSTKYEQMPVGNKNLQVTQEVRAANNAGLTQREQSAHIVNVMETMKASVESGDTKTGLPGVVLSYIPASDNYAFQGDLETVLANLGFDALMEARQNSTNGASGFGQLTEKELRLLQQLENDLKVGLDKETLVNRLDHVQSTFENARDRAKTDWSIRQWLGYEEPPLPEVAETDSGYAEGTVIENPETGETMIMRNGEWVSG